MDWLPLPRTTTGEARPTAQACALTGINWHPFTLPDDAQPTESIYFLDSLIVVAPFQRTPEEGLLLHCKKNTTFYSCKYVPLSQQVTGRAPWGTAVLEGCRAVENMVPDLTELTIPCSEWHKNPRVRVTVQVVQTWRWAGRLKATGQAESRGLLSRNLWTKAGLPTNWQTQRPKVTTKDGVKLKLCK